MKKLLLISIFSLLSLAGVFYFTQTQVSIFLGNCDLTKGWNAVSCNCELGAQHLENAPKKALSQYSKAGKVLQELVDKNPKFWEDNPYNLDITINTYQQLSKLHNANDNLGESMEYANQSLEYALFKYGDNEAPLYKFYNQIGDIFVQLQEFYSSLDYFKKAIYVLKKEYGADQQYTGDPKVLAKTYTKLGYAQFKLGLTKPAMEHYKKALQLIENQENTIPLQIEIHKRMAHICLYICPWEKAYEAINYSDSLWSANEEAYLVGKAYYQLKRDILWTYGYIKKCERKYDETLYYFKEAAKYLERAEYGYAGTEGIRILMETAEVYLNKREEHPRFIDSSMVYAQKALHAASYDFKSFDVYELPKMENLREVIYVYDILNALGRVNQRKTSAQEDEALEIKGLESALSYVSLCDSLHKRNFKRATTLRRGRLYNLVSKSIMTFDYGLFFCNLLYQLKPDPVLLEKAFYYLQRKKAQLLWLATLKEQSHKIAAIPDSLIEREKQLLNDIVKYEKQVVEYESQRDSFNTHLYQNEFLFESRRAHEEIQSLFASDYPDYFNAQIDFRPETIQSLQNVLEEDELLIDLSYNENNGSAFIFSKNKSPKFINLTPTQEVQHTTNRVIRDLYRLLQNSTMNRTSSRAKFVEWSHHLYQHFIRPIEKDLIGKKRLIIIGEGITNYIPFEILLKSNAVESFQDLDFLVKDFEISYHYSSTLFALNKRKERPAGKGIFAFAPIYDDRKNAAIASNKLRQLQIDTTLRFFGQDGNLIPLPASEFEAETIIKLFDNQTPNNNKTALRFEATEASLKENLEQPFQFIHIAGHSFANLLYPKHSGIACHSDPQNAQEDDMLYTGEIYNLDIQADLVTLSSCESGMGKLQISDGLLGINRAFIYAGTPNVVFSLWKVYDKVSANLMVDFYKNVLEGQSYSTSLRNAKLKLLEEEVTASPHFWSPFLLIGR